MTQENPDSLTYNPGSEAARTRGCICAVLDNNHGKFAPWPDDGWWITEGCPVHHPSGIEEP
jgi:phage tail protein X